MNPPTQIERNRATPTTMRRRHNSWRMLVFKERPVLLGGLKKQRTLGPIFSAARQRRRHVAVPVARDTTCVIPRAVGGAGDEKRGEPLRAAGAEPAPPPGAAPLRQQ